MTKIEELLNKFNFKKAADFLKNNDIQETEEELNNTAKKLIKLIKEDTDKDTVISTGYLKIRKEDIGDNTTQYSLHLDIGLDVGINIKKI